MRSNIKFNRQFLLVDYLILIVNLTFCCLYLILSLNNRISHDDFYSMYIVEEFGVLNGVKLIYNQWCTRYMALIISFLVTYLLKFKLSLFIYQIFLFFFGTYSIFFLLKSICENLKYPFFKIKLINYSLLLLGGMFYCSFNIGETWFWLSSSCTYLLSLIVLIFSVGLIINVNKSLIHFFFLALCGFYIGGSNGTLSLIILFSVCFITILQAFYKYRLSKNFIYSNLIKKIIVFNLFVQIAFLLLYLGKGNEIRSSYFKDISILNAVVLNLKFSAILLLKLVLKVLPFSFIFSIAFSNFLQERTIKINTKYLMNNIFISSLLLVLFIYIFQLPITYKTQDIGANRTIYPISLATFLTCIYVIYLLFSVLQKQQLINLISVLSLLILISFNSYQIYNQYSITSNYSKSFDKRIIDINKQKKSTIIYIKPLPKPGYLHSAEISKDTAHFTHRQIKLGLKLKSEIRFSD